VDLKGGEQMTVKMTVAMICAYLKVSTDELADMAQIDRNHLRAIRAGRSKMSADDLMGLSIAANLDPADIERAPEKQ
jgi:hypothetical protein